MNKKDYYFKYSNLTIRLFFLSSEEDEFIEAFKTKDIKNLCKVACLELDINRLFKKSRWRHVQSEFDLNTQCTRMKMNTGDKYMMLSNEEIKQQEEEAPELFEGTTEALNNLTKLQVKGTNE